LAGGERKMIEHIYWKLYTFYIEGWWDIARTTLIACALALLIILTELFFVDFKESSLKRLIKPSKSALIDMVSFVMVELHLSLMLGMGMFFGVTYLINMHLKSFAMILGQINFESPLLQVLIFFLMVDFLNYWIHRFCHEWPVLWIIHKYHHSAVEMTVLTSARDHPMERALATMIFTLPAAVLLFPQEYFIVVWLFAKLIGLLKHSNIKSNWGVLGEFVIQSPVAHRVHHSKNPMHHNKNYGSLFQIWDVIFGTAYLAKENEADLIELGVDGDDGAMSPIRYIFYVFAAFWKSLIGIRN
jgi:sterol desaturase/sphingolipid hydroxylase (fatty acid hydroxylase superfamily)